MRLTATIVFLLSAVVCFSQQNDTLVVPLNDSLVRIESAPASSDEEGSTTQFNASVSLGLTFTSNDNSDDANTVNLNWLGKTDMRFAAEGRSLHFLSTLFAQFGQYVTEHNAPRKTQDDLILSLVPSLTLSDALGLRVFLEVTGETDIAQGIVDDTVATTFLDPLFLYETLFLGHKTALESSDGALNFELTFGIGYALQQTVTNNFILASNREYVIDGNNPLQSVQDQFTLENGYSFIFDMFYKHRLSENMNARLSMKTVALTKKDFFDDTKKARVGGLLQSGITYRIFNLDYTMRLVYDNEISSRRQIEQTLVFGLQLEI